MFDPGIDALERNGPGPADSISAPLVQHACSCRGGAFRIVRADAESELELLWREMVTGAYVPRWVRLHGHSLPEDKLATAFTINRKAPNYVRPASEADTAVIATACGGLGSCRDYLFYTVHGLEEFGIHDHIPNRIAPQVREHRR